MKEVLDFLTENSVFYLATTENDQPRVRPMGFVMEYGGKLCMGSSNTKPMFAQMKANPKIELSAAAADGKWLRVCGKFESIPDVEAKKKAFEVMPMLANMYKVDDGIFEIFAIVGATATFSSMTGESKTVKF